MDELISILLKVGDTEYDEYLALFLASAGLIVAFADNEMHDDEINQILDSIAGLKIFPRIFLDEIAKGDVVAIFNQAVGALLDINPAIRQGLIDYMICITMSDKKFAPEEIGLLYEFGASIGFSEKEIAASIADAIQKSYIPSLESIC